MCEPTADRQAKTRIFSATSEADAYAKARVLRQQRPTARVFVLVDYPLDGERQFRVLVTHDERAFRLLP